MTNINKKIVDAFDIDGEFFYSEPFGCGHINSTLAVYFKAETSSPKRYIFQKINTNIFKNPIGLMENIEKVTEHIRKKLSQDSKDITREVLTIVKTKTGENFHIDEEDNFWRAYIFIEDATSYQIVENPILFYNSAKAFGKFQRLLSDFPAQELHETIEKFHNTNARFEQFMTAVNNDAVGKVASVQAEIDFVKARKEDCATILDLIEAGQIPLRVTHNDTKLNNIMIDNETLDGICVIDLDTVMPGSVLFDFGDSIRFGASSALEDEKDLDKVYMVLDLFEQYTKGFLSEAKSALNQVEIDNLAWSAKIMTLECGMRFLADHINGDVYFKISKENQNLDRARTQFKLVADMEEKMEQMNDIVRKYA